VTCKANGSQKVVCKVRYVGSSSQNERANVSWRLMQGGHARSHGRTSVRRLNLVLGRLKPGRYVLQVDGQRTSIAVPAGGSQA
jgi:hypothetical protein